MEGGIKIKSMNDYKKDIVRFQDYLVEIGGTASVLNHLLDPKEETTSGHRDQQASQLVQYAIYLSKDESLSPSAFDAQFQAIKRFMMHNIRDTRVFDMESVTEARRIARSIVAGSRKRVIEAMEPRERASYEARYCAKVPFTEEMMRAHRTEYLVNRMASIEDKMAYMATALGYHIGNRPSEGSSNGPLAMNSNGQIDEDHRFMVEDIQYQLSDGSFITGVDIDAANKDGIQFISVMVTSHKGETIKMMSSKGATKRQANSVRKDNGDMELELFNDLIEWPGIAKLQPHDVFFSRNTNGKNLKLTTAHMVARMKNTASKQGINPTLISAKSLRKALATDLTRSNVPKGTMNSIGRWAPNSDVGSNIYSAATAGDITGTMSGGISRTSNNDILRLGRSRDQMTKETERR